MNQGGSLTETPNGAAHGLWPPEAAIGCPSDVPDGFLLCCFWSLGMPSLGNRALQRAWHVSIGTCLGLQPRS